MRTEPSGDSPNARRANSLPASPEGRLVVVSGPSGVGKSTIVAAVMKELGAEFSVSATTRRPRPHEVDGVDYHFVDRTTFEEMRAQGDILEWAEYGGNLYGTPLSSVRPIVERGVDVILDIENEGARQIRAAYDGAVLIFILPPSLTELERRLRGRGDTSTEDM
ncbi:MAG: guanylate kinase, partial [Acidimicrobiia bacterium]|nr:guanylate kinase [Acidimicrobiia bacterium]